MMKKKKIIIIIIIALVIIVIGVFYKFNDILLPLVIQNEKVGVYEINKMQECKNISVEDKTLKLIGNDTEVTLPLPKGAVEFKNEDYPNDNQFLISVENTNINNYIEEVLPANGFTTARSGAMVFVTKDDEDIKIEMLIDMYTKNFMRLNFSIINNQKNNFTRTYEVLNIEESNDENYLYLTIKQFQQEEVEAVKVLKNLANSVEANKNYEFTFKKTNLTIEDSIGSIFENAELISIKENDKTGLEQIQEKI